ncbi:hypothetical protein D9M68_897030 [compost metagenome]
MGQRFSLGGGDAGFGGAHLGGEISFDSVALGSEVGLDRFTRLVGNALSLGLGGGQCSFISGNSGVRLLARGVCRGEIGINDGLAVGKDATDAGQGDFAHQQVERAERDGEPQQLAGECRRVKRREHA